MSESPTTRSTTATITSNLRQAGSQAGTVAGAALGRTQHEIRRHRQEMLILAATLAFVLVVGAIALMMVLG